MEATRQRAVAKASSITGTAMLDWASPVEETTDGWLFDPGGTTTTNAIDRQPITTRPKLYRAGLPAPDVTARDRMVVDGDTYTVIGDPSIWDGGDFAPGGGIVVELERVTD
jgi:hypothetical protein